jgi:heme O synthase-like polyprenyltransferase
MAVLFRGRSIAVSRQERYICINLIFLAWQRHHGQLMAPAAEQDVASRSGVVLMASIEGPKPSRIQISGALANVGQSRS